MYILAEFPNSKCLESVLDQSFYVIVEVDLIAIRLHPAFIFIGLVILRLYLLTELLPF